MFINRAFLQLCCLVPAILGTTVTAAGGEFPAEPAALEDIRISGTDTRLEIDLIYHLDLTPHIFRMAEPGRIVIDLPGITEIRAPARLEVEDFGILRIRSGMFRMDTARVVLDCFARVPEHRIEPRADGLAVIFTKAPAAVPDKTPAAAGSEPSLRKLEENVEEVKTAVRENSNKLDQARSQLEGAQSQLEETQAGLEQARTRLDEAVTLLQAMESEQRKKSRRFVRIQVVAGYFMPEDGVFKETFDNGLMEGAEFSVGVMDMLEFWAAVRNFSKAAVEPFDPERRIRLTPLEAGLKLRFAKAAINPYIGGGAAYHQYREIHPDGEISQKKIGFVGQAGCFIKIAENLVFDFYAHYRACTIRVEHFDLKIGGFFLGAGLGFEF